MIGEISIDPVTRIEGHLGIHVNQENNRVTEAYCVGQMYRGFEPILIGRDPLDAQQITQRICGVCPISHGIASGLAQDDAYTIEVPPSGVILRNLILAANILQSHITHFYLFSILDFINITAVREYKGNDSTLCTFKDWINAQLASKEIFPAAPFLPQYNEQLLQNTDANIITIRNYLEALNIRALSHQIAAIFAGKIPHAPALIPGGITGQVTAKKIAEFSSKLKMIRRFIDECYLPDIITVAEAFPEFFDWGKSGNNFLAYGVFPEPDDLTNRLFPAGVIRNGQFEPLDISFIREEVLYSRFTSATDLPPEQGETIPQPQKQGAYSWLKAPRYDKTAMEVGPLARVYVAYHSENRPEVKSLVDAFLVKLNRKPDDLKSTLGRHIARALESKLIADRCSEWIHELIPDAPTCANFSIPNDGNGIGLVEAPRGALGHWLEFKNKKIVRYQCVVPSTWNFSPRDDRGIPGIVEQALIGTPIANRDQPIEVARVVRSFDPCIACAVH